MSEKNCRNCINCCMEPSDMNPYCAVVNKPWGHSLTKLPRPKECAGEKGDDYKLWEEDTRGRPTFCKLCGKKKLSFQVFCGAACSVEWESGKRP